MPERLLKNFSIEIQQKLYEQETPDGDVVVYETSLFGLMLIANNQIVISEHDGFFYHEMMSHPVLFTHPNPEKIALVGNTFGILQEVLKHLNVTDVDCINDHTYFQDAINQYFPEQKPNDTRIKYRAEKSAEWLAQSASETYDVIIQVEQSENFLEANFKHYFRLLKTGGMLIQPCRTSLLYSKLLKPIYQNIHHAGFNDWQMLNFPQPSYPSGSRTAIMATKHSTLHRIREKAIFNRPFTTRYYNFDVHKAALVLPEFMRQELGIETP